MQSRRFWIVAGTITVSLLLSACKGVPLSTAWSLRNFSAEDFAQLDPDEIRAALQVADDLGITAGSIQLQVKLHGGDDAEPRKYVIPLRRDDRGRAQLPDAARGNTWHVVGIAPPDRAEFTRLQAALGAEPEAADRQIELTIGCSFETPPRAGTDVPLEMRLQLDADNGFFRLYKGKVTMPSDGPDDA